MSEGKNILDQESEDKSKNLPAGRQGSDPIAIGLNKEKNESSVSKQQETSNPVPPGHAGGQQPAIENMETHAHHLHKAPGKNFWHYFFEFLMLFLAVFCGFLAENLREHQLEKERAKQYINSLYEDLRYDTVRLTTIIDTESSKIASLSRMPECYDIIKRNWTGTSCLLDLIKNSRSNNNFQITGRTLKQLANAGGFRLLRRQDADSIVGYENDANDIRDFETTLYQQAQDNVRNTFNELVEFTANTKLYSNVTVNPGTYNADVKLPLLFSADKILLNKYFNQLFQYMRAIVRHRIQLIELKQHASRLIEYYKNKTPS